ncbi:C-type lectin domain family 17, member A-like [Menidia menidia]
MAEGVEVLDASVAFSKKQAKQKAKREEETVYEEVVTSNETAEKNPDLNAELLGAKPDEDRSHRCQQLACSFGTIFLILLLAIKGVCIYQNETASLNAENQKLNTEIKQLEAEKKNLTEELKNMKEAQIKFNTSRAQWSIDAYCPKTNNIRTCRQCERGWLNNQDSCYTVNNPEPAERRSWEEARKICRGKGSDLVVVDDEKEKTFVNYKSWGKDGFWIGLKAENGTWKWIDERDLANNSWMTQQPQDGQCVISVEVEGWKSVSCDDKRQWICEKAALSV